MKNSFKLAVLTIATAFIFSCKSSDSPEKVTELFLKHMNKKEYSEAKKLGTEQTKSFITMIESFEKIGGSKSNDSVKEIKIENIKCDSIYSLKIDSTFIDPKTNMEQTISVQKTAAVCSFTKNGVADKQFLIKENGKWLVDMKKENPADSSNINIDNPSDSTIVK